MALAFTNRVNDPDTSNVTAYATPAITPSANAGIVAAVLSSHASAPEKPSLDSPTWLSGSWTEEIDQTQGGMRLIVWSGRTVASPGSDDLNLTFSVAATGVIIQVFDVTGVDATDYVLQPESAAGGGGTQAFATATLNNALAGTDSAMVLFAASLIDEAHAPNGTETELADGTHSAPTRGLSTQYEINATTSRSNWTTASQWAVGALEIKAGVSSQKARATAVVAADEHTDQAGATSNAALIAAVDEASPDTADYVISPPSPGTAKEVKFRLGALNDPSVSNDHKLSYKYGKQYADGDTINQVVTLYAADGTTVIKSATHNNVGVGPIDGDFTLTSGEADSIPSADYATGLVVGIRTTVA